MAAFNMAGVQEWGSQLWRRRNRPETANTPGRREIRYFATTSMEVNASDRRRIGLLRDISRTGIFFYSDFTPEVGQELEITFKLPNEGQVPVWVTCHGIVVRTEARQTGAAIGIGLRLTTCRLKHPTRR